LSFVVAFNSLRKYWRNEVTSKAGVFLLLFVVESLAYRRRCFTLSIEEERCLGGKEVGRFIVWYFERSFLLLACLMLSLLVYSEGGWTEGNWSNKVKVVVSSVQSYMYVYIYISRGLLLRRKKENGHDLSY
jgi:hypothetical protein